jgi:uncharacterized protein (TIGR00369 family)
MTEPASLRPRTRTITWNDPLATAAGADGRTGLEFLRAIIAGHVPPPPIGETLSFALIAADEGVARFRGAPDEIHMNPMNQVHGGYAATLLDSAMGSAVMSTLDRDTAYTTVELSIRLTRAIMPNTGAIVAEGRIVHRGSRIATAEGRLTDAEGRLLAHGTTTCLLMPRK